MSVVNWFHVQRVPSRKWTCGHCGMMVGGDAGYYKNVIHVGKPSHFIGEDNPTQFVLICPSCEKPTFFDGGNQVPGAAFGKPVQHLPADLDEIYTEARNCMSVNAFVPAVLTARTILMHVAVERGAAEGLAFTDYVDYFVAGGFVPPNSQGWIDHIRKAGNAATHKIALMTRDDAEKVLRFIEMILLFLYEYPNAA